MKQETELEKKTRVIADNFKQVERLYFLTPKFERSLLKSPFAFYGFMRQFAELEDENSAYSQFVRDFLRDNRFNN